MTTSMWRFSAVLFAGFSVMLGGIGLTNVRLQEQAAQNPGPPSPTLHDLPPSLPSALQEPANGAIKNDPLFREIQQRVGQRPRLIDDGESALEVPSSEVNLGVSTHREAYMAAEAMLRAARLLEVELAGIAKDGESRGQKDANSSEVRRERRLLELIERLRRDVRQVLGDLPD